MHLKGTDLDLKGLSAAADQGGMQGLVHIGFWHGNIILETTRNGFIHLMDHSQCCITVLYRIHDDPHGKQIINLIQGLSLIFHFLINTEKMLYTAINLRLDAGIFNMLADLIHNVLNILFTHTFAHCDLIDQIIIDIRFQIF